MSMCKSNFESIVDADANDTSMVVERKNCMRARAIENRAKA